MTIASIGFILLFAIGIIAGIIKYRSHKKHQESLRRIGMTRKQFIRHRMPLWPAP